MISVNSSKINAVKQNAVTKNTSMNANNNSAANNNATASLATALEHIQGFVAELKATPRYKIEIADRTGHTTMADLSLEEATNNILENAESNARWVFINGEKFEFEGANYRAEANVQKLQAKLAAMHDPAVLLTGVLVGGLV